MKNAAAARATLQTAVKYGDAESMRTAAHGLKAASGNVGARRAMEICRRLEASGRGGSVDGAEALLSELDAELEIVGELLLGESRKVANG